METPGARGGGTKGGLWTQIVSDVLGRPQEIRRQTIGACYGDAFLAAIAGGLVDAGARWNEVADMTRPNPQVTEMCDPLYDIYRSLYPATRDQLHRLADMQEGAAEPMT